MSFTMAPLLVHNEAVPEDARSALRAALASDNAHRTELLTVAARILHAHGGLDCSDVRELVDLPPGGGCEDG